MTFIHFLFTKTFLKQLGLALLAMILLAVLVLWWLRGTTNHGQKIEVPDLTTMTETQAIEALEELDLRMEIMDTTNYNPEFEYKTVIEQIPKAGKFVKEDRKIYISLNRSGYPMIQVPDVVGKTQRQAEPTLLAVGFQIGKVTNRPHISDQVLEIRHDGGKIQPGDKLRKTSVIDLIVGDASLNRIRNEAEDADENSQTSEDGAGAN